MIYLPHFLFSIFHFLFSFPSSKSLLYSFSPVRTPTRGTPPPRQTLKREGNSRNDQKIQRRSRARLCALLRTHRARTGSNPGRKRQSPRLSRIHKKRRPRSHQGPLHRPVELQI